MSIDWKAVPYVAVAFAIVFIISFAPWGKPIGLTIMALLALGCAVKFSRERAVGATTATLLISFLFVLMTVATLPH